MWSGSSRPPPRAPATGCGGPSWTAPQGWPLRDWIEEHDVWSPADGRYVRLTRHRILAVLTWHSLRHRFARLAIDIYRADAGMLMALGGWENEVTVLNRYYRTGAEHTRRGLARFSQLLEIN